MLSAVFVAFVIVVFAKPQQPLNPATPRFHRNANGFTNITNQVLSQVLNEGGRLSYRINVPCIPTNFSTVKLYPAHQSLCAFCQSYLSFFAEQIVETLNFECFLNHVADRTA